MSRLLHKLRYFCTDAWDEFRHSRAVNLMAVATLASALFIAGIVMLVVYNIDRRAQGLREELRVEVFLLDAGSEAQREMLQQELAGMPGVRRVEWVSKEQALERYRRWASAEAALVEVLDHNPLPASFEVYLSPGSGTASAAAIAARFAEHPAVERVRYDQDLIQRLEGIVDLVRSGGGLVAAIVLLAVAFVMASVLRLAVLARRDEIEIMRLVGATPGFIRGPFLVAGLVQGVVAALVALATLELARRAGVGLARDGAAGLLALIAGYPLSASATGLLAAIGVSVSLTGSWFAVRRG
jgi:cell division transport system permease protein